ncbi:hypothetical protein C8R45DRAFT_1102153 [Mycena sanguinolenta]|nr:hypothetical protein C8R45DRAFT_1102153 [Mycena sanguinolenta]
MDSISNQYLAQPVYLPYALLRNARFQSIQANSFSFVPPVREPPLPDVAVSSAFVPSLTTTTAGRPCAIVIREHPRPLMRRRGHGFGNAPWESVSRMRVSHWLVCAVNDLDCRNPLNVVDCSLPSFAGLYPIESSGFPCADTYVRAAFSTRGISISRLSASSFHWRLEHLSFAVPGSSVSAFTVLGSSRALLAPLFLTQVWRAAVDVDHGLLEELCGWTPIRGGLVFLKRLLEGQGGGERARKLCQHGCAGVVSLADSARLLFSSQEQILAFCMPSTLAYAVFPAFSHSRVLAGVPLFSTGELSRWDSSADGAAR